MKKPPGFNGCVYDFFVDYRDFDISDITNIHKYLIKKTWYRMFGIIKKCLLFYQIAL